MTAARERWMLAGTLLLTILFVCFFIVPNYNIATHASTEADLLEERIEQLQLRQIEVEQMHHDFKLMQAKVQDECKQVPSTPDMSQIVKTLSLEVDGRHVLDQSFTAGSITAHPKLENVFEVQPLAVTLHADFESIFTVIQNVESMNRLVQISSVRVSRKEADADKTAPVLEAAIGLHAMYDMEEEVE
jgi:Tfp pilus assembly protein PilO